MEFLMPRVLLVDDEKNVLKTLSIGLRRLAYGVEEANTGQEALKVLARHPVDVVVSDIRMSPMDGYTLASEIRKRYPRIPVILMSAYGFENQQVEEKDGIFYPKLTKPFSVHQLVDKLKEVESALESAAPKICARMLVFGSQEIQKDIANHLKSTGLSVTGEQARESFLKKLEDDSADCILIDEQMLQDADWKVLNDLDAMAPDIPVLLLVDGSGSGRHTLEGLGVSLIDRKTFFKDHQWIRQCIQSK